MFHPDDAKTFYMKLAGQQYEPSNGTEGEIFWSEWCMRCSKDKPMSEGKDIDDCEPGEVCEILGASFRGEAKEWVYGKDGQPTCTAFTPIGTPPRDDRTIDMFDAAIAQTPEGKDEPCPKP